MSAPQRNVRYWHKADVDEIPINVRFGSKADIIMSERHVRF